MSQGEPVSIDKPIAHDFSRKLVPGDPRKIFPTTMVVSYEEKEKLPNRMEPGRSSSPRPTSQRLTICYSVTKLCDIESDLSGQDEKNFKEKNKKIWKPGPRYYRVDYQIKVLIGPADLRFELCEFHLRGQSLAYSG